MIRRIKHSRPDPTPDFPAVTLHRKSRRLDPSWLISIRYFKNLFTQIPC